MEDLGEVERGGRSAARAALVRRGAAPARTTAGARCASSDGRGARAHTPRTRSSACVRPLRLVVSGGCDVSGGIPDAPDRARSHASDESSATSARRMAVPFVLSHVLGSPRMRAARRAARSSRAARSRPSARESSPRGSPAPSPRAPRCSGRGRAAARRAAPPRFRFFVRRSSRGSRRGDTKQRL